MILGYIVIRKNLFEDEPIKYWRKCNNWFDTDIKNAYYFKTQADALNFINSIMTKGKYIHYMRLMKTM